MITSYSFLITCATDTYKMCCRFVHVSTTLTGYGASQHPVLTNLFEVRKHFVVLSYFIMVESKSTTAVVLLNGLNYPTWKIQCKMALMKEGLWKIVTGEVTLTGGASELTKFAMRRDRG